MKTEEIIPGMNHIFEVLVLAHEKLIHFHCHGDLGEHEITMDKWLLLGSIFLLIDMCSFLSYMYLTFASSLTARISVYFLIYIIRK